MSDIDIPQESKCSISTRIDTVAYDIIRKLSIEKYGSRSNMSAVLTEAVRFVHNPTPTQRVAKEKYANDIDVYPRDPDCSDSKVIHWTAPTNLEDIMRSLSTNNRDFIESAIYLYEAYYTEMTESFSVESVAMNQVVEWDVLENNYSQTLSKEDVRGADVPRKPSARRPFIYALTGATTIRNFELFSTLFYDKLESEQDVSGLPQRETRQKDFQSLIEDKYLIPTPAEMADVPIYSVDPDIEAYYPRRVLQEDNNSIELILNEYIDEMEQWFDHKTTVGEIYETTDAVFQRRENTLSVISNYEIPELQEYVDWADELQQRMVEELVEMGA